MRPAPDIAPLKARIVRAHPELEAADFRLINAGWDSVAIIVDSRLIFRFPRDAQAQANLRREAGLLAVLAPRLTMRVTQPTLHGDGPDLFSEHEMIPGAHLDRADYENLPERRKQALAEALGQFYAELHALDLDLMRKAGAEPHPAWPPAERILHDIRPLLPPALQDRAQHVLRQWSALSPDEEVFGYFDGHGWNMAFDHEAKRLNGIYDFGDAGLGPRHRDFVSSSLTSPDLTLRIMDVHDRLADRTLDRGRIAILTGVHRLFELAETVEDRTNRDMVMGFVIDWFERDDFA